MWIFQYPLSDRGQCNQCGPGIEEVTKSTFSILYRIVGSVTQLLRPAITLSVNFQYPLSDRGQCNQDGHGECDGGPGPFSILYRIVGSVTKPLPPQVRGHQVFQYPLSDRGQCNLSLLSHSLQTFCLSVSSIGSWAV